LGSEHTEIQNSLSTDRVVSRPESKCVKMIMVRAHEPGMVYTPVIPVLCESEAEGS
jgi:hypothetical protein